ncbi:MAG TPA: DUF5615 family PIN-like protein [Pirellulales bacterium]|jgi:predicted nuclease of predicted toxin-antitoxin system|nr:DUF5615 family PIN-like protein [Pirellulales bacterium]
MARLLADEHFDFNVANHLRSLGHDVATVRQHSSNKSGDGMEDEDVLALARAERRVLLTENISDFKSLHDSRIPHAGIIACSPAGDEPARDRAKRIAEVLRSHGRHIKQQWVRLHSWNQVSKNGANRKRR